MCILEDNIKMNLTEIGCEVVDWMNVIIFLADDSVFKQNTQLSSSTTSTVSGILQILCVNV